MPDLNEDLLQFVWQHKLLKPERLLSKSGKEIVIIKPGEVNRDSGPDFFNARIGVDGLILAGNIEIHVKSSHWIKHNHQADRNYDNIILHVVYEHDMRLEQNHANNVEVLEIKNLLPDGIAARYQDMLASGQTIACHKQLAGVEDLKFTSWLQRMFAERLEHKVKNIESLFANYNGDYTQTFYTILLRNFGFKVNSVPFELLSKQLPLVILLKHADNLKQLEALLLGGAGLLEQQLDHKYMRELQNEFEYLKNKYQITPLRKEIFKFSRLRPANFATLRLAQFAALVYSSPTLFTSPQQFNTYEKIATALKTDLNGYWKNHYNVTGSQVQKELGMGDDSISNIITNTFSSFFFFYHKKTSRPEFENVPLQLMEKCAFEKNIKTRLFMAKKSQLVNAADSQGLIHLHDNYCAIRKCLKCGIATAILSAG